MTDNLQKYTINKDIWELITDNLPFEILNKAENSIKNFEKKLEVGFSWNEINKISKKLKIEKSLFFVKRGIFWNYINNYNNKFIEFRSDESLDKESFYFIRYKWLNPASNFRNLVMLEDDNFVDFSKLFLSKNADSEILEEKIKKFLKIKNYRKFIQAKNFPKANKAKLIFNYWRKFLFEKQILVLLSSPTSQGKLNSVSGVSWYFKNWPIVIISNSTSWNRKIFSLFHELVHLFKSELSISDINNFDLEKERNVNKIVGNILFSGMEEELNKLVNNDSLIENIEKFSDFFAISREATLYKMYFDRLLNKERYFSLKEFIKLDDKSKLTSEKGGNYIYNNLNSMGKSLILKLSNLYNFGELNEIQLKKFTNIKAESLKKFVHQIEKNLWEKKGSNNE